VVVSTAVSSQPRRSTDLGEEVRTSALRTPLVASSRAHTVPVVCSGVSSTLRRHTSPGCFTEPPTSMVAAACVLPLHPRCLFHPLVGCHSEIVRFQWRPYVHGTTHQPTSEMSLLTYRRRLKTFLFHYSYGRH